MEAVRVMANEVADISRHEFANGPVVDGMCGVDAVVRVSHLAEKQLHTVQQSACDQVAAKRQHFIVLVFRPIVSHPHRTTGLVIRVRVVRFGTEDQRLHHGAEEVGVFLPPAFWHVDIVIPITTEVMG